MIKLRIVVGVLISACIVLFSSCLHSTEYSNDAQMLTFSMAGFPDTTYTFVVDESSKSISNAACPLPFETNLTALVPIYTTSSYSYVYAKDSLYIDSATYTAQASGYSKNDFSGPVDYMVTSQSGNTQVVYTVNVVTSNVNPNEVKMTLNNPSIGGNVDNQNLIWFHGKMWYFGADASGTNASVMTSTDLGVTWQTNPLSIPATSVFKVAVYNDSLYLVDANNTYVSDGTNAFVSTGQGGKSDTHLFVNTNDDQLVALSAQDGTISYASNSTTWTDASNPSLILPNAGSCFHNGQMYLVGGNVIKLADHADGNWVSVASPANLMDPMVFSYSGRLWILGGVDETGTTTKNIYYSRDGGLNWKLDSRPNIILPTNYSRAGAQATIDPQGNLWLVGGYSQVSGGSRVQYSDVLVGKMNTIIE